MQYFSLPSISSYFELKYSSTKVKEIFYQPCNDTKISASWSRDGIKKKFCLASLACAWEHTFSC